MKKAMKAMKAGQAKKSMKAMKSKSMKAMKSMTKTALADAVATACDLKRSQVNGVLSNLAEVAAKHVKSDGIFTVPGLCRIKTRRKAATKAGKREIFGEMRVVKAKPARTVVKAFPVAALKSQF